MSNCASREEFLAPSLRPETMDRWFIRSAILEAVRREAPRMSGTVLDVGCGQQPYRSLVTSQPHVSLYVGVDVPSQLYTARDVTWDGEVLPFAEASVDQVLATELLEHCPHPQRVLDEMGRVLRPGGRILITVPFLWPLHDSPYDEYRYTPYALKRMLSAAGFVGIDVRSTGAWDASLAQMLGLWVRRRPMGDRKRRMLSTLVFPLYRRLLAMDDSAGAYGENVMLTGLAATASRPAG